MALMPHPLTRFYVNNGRASTSGYTHLDQDTAVTWAEANGLNPSVMPEEQIISVNTVARTIRYDAFPVDDDGEIILERQTHTVPLLVDLP